MVAFCSTVCKNSTDFFCRKSGQLTLSVDLKIESVLQARRKQIKFYMLLVNEERKAVTVTVHSR